MDWTHESTTTLTMPQMTMTMTRRRKKIAGPPLPDTGAERTEQVRKFMHDLADHLYDYDHHDVYNSVYFQRIQDIMVDTVFDDTRTHTIRDLGREILDTRSTSVKLYIAFFKSVLAYLDTL